MRLPPCISPPRLGAPIQGERHSGAKEEAAGARRGRRCAREGHVPSSTIPSSSPSSSPSRVPARDHAERADAEFEGLGGIGRVREKISNPPGVMERLGGVVHPDPLRRARVPARRLERLAGLLPVVRQQGRLLVERVGVMLLDGLRHRGVGAPPPLPELGAERHLLGQRMGERVLGDGIERLLVDELGLLVSAASESVSSTPGSAATAARIGSLNSFPITAAAWRSCFSRSARRSMRAASTACTVAGTSRGVDRSHQPIGAPRARERSRLRPATARSPRRRRDCPPCARRSAPPAPRARRVPSRSASSAPMASGPSGRRGSCWYHDFCIQSARYSGRKFTSRSVAFARDRRPPRPRRSTSLAASAQ